MSDLNENKSINIDADTDNGAEDIIVPPEKPKKRFSGIIDYVELFVIAICVVILLFSFVFRTCNVDGSSMRNTLYNGETLIISDLAYTPKRGDIIVFHQNGDDKKPLIKRVIGVEGDTVTINFKTWEVVVTDKNGNTSVLEEDYVYIQENRHHILEQVNGGIATYTVPEGSVFVLGDNRNNSMDSTYNDVGFVDEDNILGKVLFRVTPISKLGFVE